MGIPIVPSAPEAVIGAKVAVGSVLDWARLSIHDSGQRGRDAIAAAESAVIVERRLKGVRIGACREVLSECREALALCEETLRLHHESIASGQACVGQSGRLVRLSADDVSRYECWRDHAVRAVAILEPVLHEAERAEGEAAKRPRGRHDPNVLMDGTVRPIQKGWQRDGLAAPPPRPGVKL